jgi:hypothetical protein
MGKKFNRRKMIVLTIIAGASAFIGKFIFSNGGSRKLAGIPATVNIDFGNLTFLKAFNPRESKLSARALIFISRIRYGVKISEGHNTRQFSDLTQYAPQGKLDLSGWELDALLESSLEERERNTKNFYIRTEKPNKLNFELKGIDVSISEGDSKFVDVETFRNEAKDLGSFMLECAGNDHFSKFSLMSASRWSGVFVDDFFNSLDSKGEHTHVLVEGFDDSNNTNWNRFPGLVESTPGASWIFTLEELKKHKAFFATSMNGRDLTADHGYPLRLVVPCFYGCASIKWLNKITFFTATDKTKTEQQMKEFSDRTNQIGIPSLYKDHRSPVIDLSSTPVKFEKWYDNTAKKYVYRLIGLTWGGVEHINPKLKIVITTTIDSVKNPAKVVLEEVIQVGDRKNPLTFSHWIHWWTPPGSGYYHIHILPVEEKIVARRLRSHYYQRMIKV